MTVEQFVLHEEALFASASCSNSPRSSLSSGVHVIAGSYMHVEAVGLTSESVLQRDLALRLSDCKDKVSSSPSPQPNTGAAR